MDLPRQSIAGIERELKGCGSRVFYCRRFIKCGADKSSIQCVVETRVKKKVLFFLFWKTSMVLKEQMLQ